MTGNVRGTQVIPLGASQSPAVTGKRQVQKSCTEEGVVIRHSSWGAFTAVSLNPLPLLSRAGKGAGTRFTLSFPPCSHLPHTGSSNLHLFVPQPQAFPRLGSLPSACSPAPALFPRLRLNSLPSPRSVPQVALRASANPATCFHSAQLALRSPRSC